MGRVIVLLFFFQLLWATALPAQQVEQGANTKIGQETPDTKERLSPKKAILYGLIPGGGQIYNKKWWKAVIVYGGFYGLYRILDFYQPLLDEFNLELSVRRATPDDSGHFPQYAHVSDEAIFKVRNFYRRQRNYAIVYLVGGYLLQIIDAYVDARLSIHDVSNDLSLKVRPNILPDYTYQGSKAVLGFSIVISYKL